MLTIEKLKEFGANTEEGLQRCMNNEAFYLKLVNIFMADKSFDKLKEAISKNDLDEAFKASHALKGVLGNLSLTPLFDIIYETTELLRNKSDVDYMPYIERYEAKYKELLN